MASVRAFPDFLPRIADSRLRESITLDLASELEGSAYQVGGAGIGVFDSLDVLVAVDLVGATVVEDSLAGLRSSLGDAPVTAGEEFEPSAGGWQRVGIGGGAG